MYESIKPVAGLGPLIRESLGPETIKLIHQNTDIDRIRDDIDELVIQALTEIFLEIKTDATLQMITNVVDDIDKIVKATRFEGWQNNHGGQREIQKVPRQTLFKYKLHKEQELFEKAYAYIREHY